MSPGSSSAKLIGENTAGAGFRNGFFPVAGGYVISVSVGRAVLASTGKDWEGVGIAPTTKVDADKALDVAQVHALRRIAATAPADEKRRLEAQAALLDAKVNPAATALPAERYAGNYDGDRSVTIDGGHAQLSARRAARRSRADRARRQRVRDQRRPDDADQFQHERPPTSRRSSSSAATARPWTLRAPSDSAHQDQLFGHGRVERDGLVEVGSS